MKFIIALWFGKIINFLINIIDNLNRILDRVALYLA